MSYFTINKKPVFLTNNQDKKFKRIISDRENDSLKKIGYLACFAGSKEAAEVSKYIFDKLTEINAKDPELFENNWYNFDLKDEEAQDNAFDLLYDYCHYYGFASLSDPRSFEDKLVADFIGENFVRPMGTIFYLNHFAKPAKSWQTLTNKIKGRTISVLIDIKKIKRIKGNLKSFVIYTKNFNIICNENFEINSTMHLHEELSKKTQVLTKVMTELNR